MGKIKIENTKRVYRCAAGHELVFTGGGDWVSMAMQFLQRDGSMSNHQFNYCMVCLGAWAEKQWPLTCEVIDSPPAA